MGKSNFKKIAAYTCLFLLAPFAGFAKGQRKPPPPKHHVVHHSPPQAKSKAPAPAPAKRLLKVGDVVPGEGVVINFNPAFVGPLQLGVKRADGSVRPLDPGTY